VSQNEVWLPSRQFIFVKEVVEKEASTEESMDTGTPILSQLTNVRMSAREEESAENRIRHRSCVTRLLGDLHEGCSRRSLEIEDNPLEAALGS
jgi:methyl coenzyme M reductase subunit C-like uncharacterized protein (methanogenesis marker protein 7)